jgi:UDP-N-acetylmuramoylalanine--D-glutamate ligase
MKIGVIGWGIETQAMYSYFGAEHSYVICSEHVRADFPSGQYVTIQTLADIRTKGDSGKNQDLSYMLNLEDCDVIALTPTARNNFVKVYKDNPGVLAKITTAQHVFFENSPTKNVIGITGSKGKSTVTTLVHAMLEKAGLHVFVGGNIGVSPLSFIQELTPESWVVLELSSYQLESLPYSPKIAVHLMMTEEHIDWHGSMDGYVDAKSYLVKNQTIEDIVVYDPNNHHSVKNTQLSRGTRIPFTKEPGAVIKDGGIYIDSQLVVKLSDMQLLGEHNYVNTCAAITAVWHITKDVDALRTALQETKPLPHHLETVHTYKNTRFVNDSVATVPAAALSAVKALKGTKNILLGGQDRGLAVDVFIEQLSEEADDIKHVVLFGEMMPRLMAAMKGTALEAKIIECHGDSITDVVKALGDRAVDADIVLLAPGFPSYDMYLKYTYRGDEFTAAVRELYS